MAQSLRLAGLASAGKSNVLYRLTVGSLALGWGSLGLLKVVPYLLSHSYTLDLFSILIGLGELALAVALITPGFRYVACWVSTAIATGLIAYSFLGSSSTCKCFGPAINGTELARRMVAAVLLLISATLLVRHPRNSLSGESHESE